MSFPGAEKMIGLGKMPFTFPREVVCEGLETPDRVDWKTCTIDLEAESTVASELKELMSSLNEENSD